MLPVAHLKAAFAGRGPKVLLPLLSEHISSNFASFDEMLLGVVNQVRAASVLYRGLLERCEHGSTFDLVIAGWSDERRRGETYVLTDHGRYGFPPWTLKDFGKVLIMPADAETMGRIRLTPRELEGHLDPVRDGLRILEAQRHTKGLQGAETEPSHGVGGFAQLTTITAREITTRILKWWPDLIGQKLNPERVTQ